MMPEDIDDTVLGHQLRFIIDAWPQLRPDARKALVQLVEAEVVMATLRREGRLFRELNAAKPETREAKE